MCYIVGMPRGPKPKYSDHLALRLEPELLCWLTEMAAKEQRTASQMARILLQEAREAREPKKGKKKPT